MILPYVIDISNGKRAVQGEKRGDKALQYFNDVISKNKSEIMNNLLKEYSEEDLEFYDDFID